LSEHLSIREIEEIASSTSPSCQPAGYYLHNKGNPYCGILRIDRIEEKSSGYSFITTAHEDMPYPMGTFIVWVGFSISEQFSYRQNVSMGAFYSTHAYTSEGAEYPSISSRSSGYWFKNSGDMVQFLRSRIHIRK